MKGRMSRLTAGVAALLLAAGFAPGAEAAPHRMQITFAGYTNRTESLTNFPVLVVLSNKVGQDFTFNDFVTTNGADLRFATNSASTNWLNYEIESWNTNAGQASYVWVQVPLIPANGQGAIWARWGDIANSSQLACTANGATWNANYTLVWHLRESGNGTAREFKDSTSNANDGTGGGGTSSMCPVATNGIVNVGQYFNGSGSSGHYIVSQNNVPDSADWTMSTWIKWMTQGGRPFSLGPNGPVFFGIFGIAHSGTVDWNTGIVLPVGVWTYVTVSRQGNTITLCTNGVQAAQNTSFSSIYTFGKAGIGRDMFGGYPDEAAQASMDEVRVSSVGRSTNWVWACYANQAANAMFNTYGAAEPVVPAWAPHIQNRTPTGVTTTGATFNGWLVSTGTSATSVYVLWGETTNAWANTNRWPAGVWTNGSYPSTNLTLTPDRAYYYTFGAVNAATHVVDAAPVSFLAGTVTVKASRRESTDEQPAAFVLSRPAAATNGALTVHYTLGGTGVNGRDYDLLETPAVIPPGASEARLPVVPSFFFGDTRPKVVTLSIAPGAYGVGEQSNATILTRVP